MSVLLDLSIFPVDRGAGVSGFVAPVIAMIRDSGHDYRLSPMGTIVETDTLAEALALMERAYTILDALGCERVYATAKLDIRKGQGGGWRGRLSRCASISGRSPAEPRPPGATCRGSQS
ncbi:MTH1187 family thiamine-binding protein [Thiocapsa sp.]|uniref:thiamine-binding protein n=1 Tax=Thiocapsa sp. TaxID=2024551 RepID=UPI003593310C